MNELVFFLIGYWSLVMRNRAAGRRWREEERDQERGRKCGRKERWVRKKESERRKRKRGRERERERERVGEACCFTAVWKTWLT